MQRLRSMAKFRRMQTSGLPRRNAHRRWSASSLKTAKHDPAVRSILTVLAITSLLSSAAAEDSPFYEGDSDFRRERVVNQTLLRRPDLAVLLDRFEALAGERQWVEAAGIYQQLMDQPNDSFEWTGEHQIRTIRQLSSEIFNRHPGLWPVYEQLYGSKAQSLLDVSDTDSCRHLARCYIETDAGRTAMLKLISSTWDHGELEQSIRGMTELLQSRRHARQLPEAFFTRAHVAAATFNAPELQSLLSETTTGRPADLGTMQTELVNYQVSISRDNSDWHHGRQLTASVSQKHSSPMSAVEWQIPRLAFEPQPSGETKTFRGALEDWSAQRSEQLQPEITSLFAVCAGDVLVFRDLDVIRAYELPSHSNTEPEQPLWQYQSQSPLSVVYEQQVDPYTGITTSHPGLERLHLSNSVISRLSTDGERIFAVEDIQRRPDPVFNRTAAYPSLDECSPAHRDAEDLAVLMNRLVALELAPQTESTAGPVPGWSIDYRGLLTETDGKPSAERHDLAGHFFFGSPTIAGTIAYVASEFDSQIFVSALESETGRLIWTQSISYVDRPLANDVVRANQAIPLICSNGLILCDNCNGQLIALRADLGTLAWTICYADSDSRQASGRWTYSQSTRHSHPGAFNFPVVCGHQVIVLPDRSQSIQCCDIRTGEPLWSIPRKGAEYLAGISLGQSTFKTTDDEVLLVVGSHSCRAVDPETGEAVWETQTGLICGHGIQVGDVFLLPVADERSVFPATPQENVGSSNRSGRSGQIIALDVNTGRPVGYDLRSQDGRLINVEAPSSSDRYQFPLGNLIAYRDLIVSVGIDRVVAFRQAGAVINELAEIADTSPLSEAQLQTLAEAEVIMGRTDEAGKHLRQAMQLASADSNTRRTTIDLYRELLYQKLEEDRRLASQATSVALLKEIESLVENEEQQARFLVKEIEHLIVARDTAALWQATDRFAEIGLHIAIPANGHPGHVTTSTSWIPGIYSQLLGELSREERKKLIAEIREDRLSELGLLSVPQLETFLELLSDDFDQGSSLVAECSDGEESWTETDSNEIHALRDQVARELAERAAMEGAYQRAELILLSMKKSCLPATRHYAMQSLISLYSKLDCHTLAAANLAELSTRWIR